MYGKAAMTKFEEFEQIIARLRAPDGCPWDRAQTHMSLKKPCIEEAAEVICGINILKQEKHGKEWADEYLPGAFEEAKELIEAAKERKGFNKRE